MIVGSGRSSGLFRTLFAAFPWRVWYHSDPVCGDVLTCWNSQQRDCSGFAPDSLLAPMSGEPKPAAKIRKKNDSLASFFKRLEISTVNLSSSSHLLTTFIPAFYHLPLRKEMEGRRRDWEMVKRALGGRGYSGCVGQFLTAISQFGQHCLSVSCALVECFFSLFCCYFAVFMYFCIVFLGT